MRDQGPPSRHTLEETLDVFSRVDTPGTPLTTSEVADALDCARRTAYGKLETLAEQGALETKKVGARGRIWWRPREGGQVDDTGTVSDGEAQSPTTVLERSQFDELVDAVHDYAIFVLDGDGYVQTWNDGAREIKGYDEADIVGEHFSTFYTDSDRENGRPEQNLEMAREQGRVEDEGWRVREDGTTFWANVTITPLYDDGEHQGYIKITRDMTERYEYERRLQEQRDRFEALVREVKDYAIFLLDADGIVQTWNEGAHQLKGYDEEEIIGEHFSTFYTEADREANRPERNLATAAHEGRVEDEGWRVRKDGTTFWANVIITALHDEDGDIRGYAKVTRDMTERHRYEERLREQRDELDELNQINTVIREIDQALVTATTREEIEQAVCERLADSDTYSGAWIADYADGYDDLMVRSWAGLNDEDDALERIQSVDRDAAGVSEKSIGVSALQSRSVQHVQQLEDDRKGEPWREAALGEGYESAIAVPLVYNDVEYGVLLVYSDHGFAFDQRKIDVMSELGETISHAIAAVRRKERERTLTALQRSTRQLLNTETRNDIGDIIVETLTGDLGLEDAIVYHFDTAENVLEPVSASFRIEASPDQLAPLDAGTDSPVWTAFIEGEETVTDAVRIDADSERRTMVVPLGEHGVLTVAGPPQKTFDANQRNLVELVAATAEAAFARVEHQATLRERDDLLQERNRRLQRLNQINTIIREVDQGLVQATTREEVERIACEQLTESERFRFAWIGTVDGDESLTPAAQRGTDRGYLDAVEFSTDRAAGSEPTVQALMTGEAAVVSNVAENLRSGEWRSEAFSREFQSIISVPLSYGDVTYGVLTVYADRPDAFDEMEQTVFTELGETVANAINAIETKRALLSEQLVELEFLLQDESTSVLSRLASRIGSEISFEGAIPLADDRARMFFVADTDPEHIHDVLEQSIAVESFWVIGASGDGHLVEATVSDPTIALALTEYGAALRTLTVTDTGIQLLADVPTSANVRDFVEWFQTRYESAEFVARRERERPVQTRDGLYTDLEEAFTERQLEVLETAYYSGYFELPRQSSGNDVAELLGVSQPTVSEQLRVAQRKVLDLLFDDESSRR